MVFIARYICGVRYIIYFVIVFYIIDYSVIGIALVL